MRILLLSSALVASSIVSAATPVDGWYTSVFGGYSFLPSNIDTPFNNVYVNYAGYEGGYNVGGRIGYQSHPLRYEAEYTYLTANVKQFNVDYLPQRNVSGYTTANLGLANVYYDFPDMLPAISPFLGAGIGYGYLQNQLAGSRGTNLFYFSASDSVFAYQGTAGLTYNFSENYAVNIAYRYLATSSVDSFGSVFQAHIGNAGVIYHFDHGNYK